MTGKCKKRYDWWKQHTDLDEKAGYHVSKERKEALELMKFTLDVLGDLQKTVKESMPSERTIKHWLANHEDLPLILKVQMILGLYQKKLVGNMK